MLKDIELLELISDKIFHDLAGSIGAINNGVDFLTSENDFMREKSIELIQDSSNRLITIIKLFRLLYGTIKSEGEANLNDIKNTIEEYFQFSKIKIDWPNDHLFVQNYSINDRVAKLIISIIIASTSILTNKGLISIRLNKIPTGCQINLEVSDKDIKIKNSYLQILSKNYTEETIDHKNISFYLVKRFVDLMDIELIVKEQDQQINFIIKLT